MFFKISLFQWTFILAFKPLCSVPIMFTFLSTGIVKGLHQTWWELHIWPSKSLPISLDFPDNQLYQSLLLVVPHYQFGKSFWYPVSFFKTSFKSLLFYYHNSLSISSQWYPFNHMETLFLAYMLSYVWCKEDSKGVLFAWKRLIWQNWKIVYKLDPKKVCLLFMSLQHWHLLIEWIVLHRMTSAFMTI